MDVPVRPGSYHTFVRPLWVKSLGPSTDGLRRSSLSLRLPSTSGCAEARPFKLSPTAPPPTPVRRRQDCGLVCGMGALVRAQHPWMRILYMVGAIARESVSVWNYSECQQVWYRP